MTVPNQCRIAEAGRLLDSAKLPLSKLHRNGAVKDEVHRLNEKTITETKKEAHVLQILNVNQVSAFEPMLIFFLLPFFSPSDKKNPC